MCGIFYGFMHLISDCKYEDINLDFVYIFNSISSGIIGQYCFLFFYCYAKNIYLPTVLHAIPHFFAIEQSPEKILKIVKRIFEIL